jgi:lipopolysaccharide/colanic/teichoic acid biosynthesis glycosyltransferase
MDLEYVREMSLLLDVKLLLQTLPVLLGQQQGAH